MMFKRLIFISLFFISNTNASPLDCEFIKDSDQRNLCRATTKNNATWCSFIKDHDLRMKCRAIIK